MVKTLYIPAVISLALLVSCTQKLPPTEPIELQTNGSGVTLHTNTHTLIGRNLSTKAIPYFDSAYSNNRRTADSFFERKEIWEDIASTSTEFLEKYPRAYNRITREDLDYVIAGILYDELFRRDFADDAEEEALRKGSIDENFFGNTLGVAQISPAIHKDTISTALDRELTLEEAARELLNSDSSIATIPYILYDNHPSNLALAVTRYHAGNVKNIDERAEAILGEELRTHLQSLRQ